jgi:phenylacetate-CoA ligase
MYESSSESELDPNLQLYHPEISEEDSVVKLKAILKHVTERSPFYQMKFKEANVDIEKIMSLEDLKLLPFTHKEELRDAYPLGLKAVSENEVIRIHSSSGTTGKPVIIPYTRKDVDIWALMMMRCYMMAGLTNQDRIQITPGYGLWTAGIGFQLGAERLGAMAIPTGPGNTEKQLEMLIDFLCTFACRRNSKKRT